MSNVRNAWFSIADACAYSGLGQTSLYDRLRKGKILGIKDGAKTLVNRKSMDDYLAGLPSMKK